MKGNIDEAVKAGAHTLFFPHGLGHMMGMDVHDMESLGENNVGYDEKTKRSEQFGTAYLRMARELQTGYVMTNEPGIYFIPALIDKWINEKINHDFINFDKVNQYRNFGGIRLEDDILVTETGSRNLGKQRIPITIEEVEAIAGTGVDRVHRVPLGTERKVSKLHAGRRQRVAQGRLQEGISDGGTGGQPLCRALARSACR